jgi:glycosyltransferase involved in cell wall biosynthesis
VSKVVVVCPDTNIELSVDAPERGAIRGGKSAIIQLSAAWARAGHEVTVFAGRAAPGRHEGLTVRPLPEAAGDFDVAVYVTGALGHFRDPVVARVQARVNLFWINGPHRVEPPLHVDVHWTVAPAKFLARRAIDDWGLPAQRVVVIPGEAVRHRCDGQPTVARAVLRGVYASHPAKGLREAVAVLEACRARGRHGTLDVYGTADFWGVTAASDETAEGIVNAVGNVPESDLAARMSGYGFMPYFTEWLDGFSTATAEAMAAGVVVFATAHGSNAEFVRHGWNGFLIRAENGRPDLEQAHALLLHYLESPDEFESIRRNAQQSVPTWDEQAADWAAVWAR